jgi:adenylosuccinate lyase
MATSLERLAVEIQLLGRDQVSEISEPFGAKQKGSWAMPTRKTHIQRKYLQASRLIRSYGWPKADNNLF